MWQGIKNIYHLFVAILANIWYGFPAKRIKVIGVTGTDGKTTTASLIHYILQKSGKKSSMVTSVHAQIGNQQYDTGFHVTTPSSFAVQKFLKKAVDQNCEYMVLEVTSHALDQHRVWGIDFALGVLTNITHEHLDYHKTYENYTKTKFRLLKNAEKAIINMDDESYKYIDLQLLANKHYVTYGLKQNADVDTKKYQFKTKLIGEFNTYNCLAAIAASLALGLSWDQIKKGIESFSPPSGRTEMVYDKNFSIMIDFAHTPNAIKQLLSAIKTNTKGKIIHVFGSAGKRDVSKRPFMGSASVEFADTIILTSEDPRGESIENIMDEIAKGIQSSKFKVQNLLKFEDRQEAINKAIQLAEKEDCIVITGKGHEQSMNLGDGEVPWSDYEAVKKALRLRSG